MVCTKNQISNFKESYLMLQFETHDTDENSYTNSISVNGKNILTKWGLEFGDGDVFFKQGHPLPKKFSLESLTRKKNSMNAVYTVGLSAAAYHVTAAEKYSSKKITRQYTIKALDDGYLTDIAISNGFKKNLFSQILIGGNTHGFDGLDRNHQYETSFAKLAGNDFDLEFSFDSGPKTAGFVPVVYGRSSPHAGWLIHSRLFPKRISKKFIMFCHRLYDKKIPFSDLLTRLDFLVEYLWYSGEKPSLAKRRTIGFSALGLVFVPKGTVFRLRQEIRLISKRKATAKK